MQKLRNGLGAFLIWSVMTLITTLALAVLLPGTDAPWWMRFLPLSVWPGGWWDVAVPTITAIVVPLGVGWLLVRPLRSRGLRTRLGGAGLAAVALQVLMVTAVLWGPDRGVGDLASGGWRMGSSAAQATAEAWMADSDTTSDVEITDIPGVNPLPTTPEEPTAEAAPEPQVPAEAAEVEPPSEERNDTAAPEVEEPAEEEPAEDEATEAEEPAEEEPAEVEATEAEEPAEAEAPAADDQVR